jgi:hypothetical protein
MNMITVFYRRGRKCFAPLTRDDMRRELGRDPDEAGLPGAVKDGLVLGEALQHPQPAEGLRTDAKGRGHGAPDAWA